MNFFIGREVKIKTSLGEEFEGEIFAIDVEHTSSVMLRQPKAEKYIWMKTSVVREIRPAALHATSQSVNSNSMHLPPLDWELIARRERATDEEERTASSIARVSL